MNIPQKAIEIQSKTSALKYVTKLLDYVDKHGEKMVKHGNTGVLLPVRKGNALYLTFRTIQAELTEELYSYHITQEESLSPPPAPRKRTPAPYAAARKPIRVRKNTDEKQKEAKKKYNKEYNSRPEVIEKRREYQREYYKKKRLEKASLCPSV